MNKKYIISFLGAFFVVGAISLGALSLAQTANTLSCSVEAGSVNVNQAALLTAIGGNGTYAWPVSNPTVTAAAANQFAISYPTPGNYPVTVTSGGQMATCDVNVVGVVPPDTIQCSPAVQNVMLGQTADFSVIGGSGIYAWSSPDLAIPTPSGPNFSESFPSVGLKILRVASANLITNCVVNVLANTTIPITPGLPNTGGGYGQ